MSGDKLYGYEWNNLTDYGLVKPASYIIDKSGDTYRALNGTTGKIDYSGTDASTVIQSAINALDTVGGTVFIKSGQYPLNSPINLSYKVRLVGEKIGKDYGARLGPGNIPTDEYFMKLVMTTNQYNVGGIENIFFYNWTGTKKYYGLLLDATASGSAINRFNARNLEFRDFDKSIHLKGRVYFGVFENIRINEQYSGFVGTHDVILEKGGGSSNPRINSFINLEIVHIGTTQSSIYIDGSYHNTFINVEVDGGYYDECIIKFDGNSPAESDSNVVQNFRAQDIYATANTKATIYFSGSYCAGNWVEGLIPTMSVGNTLNFDAGASRNYVKMSAFGRNPKIDATGAGENNMVEFIPPDRTAPATFTLTHSGASVIYKGYGMANSGTVVGTGAQQSIAHGCAFTPTKAQVIVSNIDDGANPYLSANPDATNIYVTAVNGKTFRWEVKYNP